MDYCEVCWNELIPISIGLCPECERARDYYESLTPAEQAADYLAAFEYTEGSIE
jgi:hypothetical protein